VLLGLVLSLGALELGVRVVQPGRWDKPVLRDLDGNEQSLSSVIGYFRESGMTRDGERMLTNLLPHMVVRGCYDRPQWDYFDGDGCVEYRINSLGFRDEEFERDKPEGELRVLALGDSFTFGLGVQQDAVWTEVLEDRLAAVRDAAVQVVNAGFACGALPGHYAPWLEGVGLSLLPDLVIVGLCLNDMGQIPMMAYNFAGTSENAGPSALWDLVQDTLGRRQVEQAVADKLSDPTAKQFDFGRIVEQDPRTWDATMKALVRMHKQTEQRGVRFIVAVFPMLSRLSSDYPYAPLHDMVKQRCGAAGIEVIDLAAPFMGLQDLDLWAHPTDQHPNDVGQAKLGDGIADWLAAHP